MPKSCFFLLFLNIFFVTTLSPEKWKHEEQAEQKKISIFYFFKKRVTTKMKTLKKRDKVSIGFEVPGAKDKRVGKVNTKMENL